MWGACVPPLIRRKRACDESARGRTQTTVNLFHLGAPPFASVSAAVPLHRLDLARLVVGHLLRVARLDVGLVLGVLTRLDAPAALELGVELRPEEHRDVRDPQPHEE